MNNQNKIVLFIITAWCLLPNLNAEKDSFPFKKKRKIQGLLTSSADNSSQTNTTTPLRSLNIRNNNKNLRAEVDAPDATTQQAPTTAPATTVVIPPPTVQAADPSAPTVAASPAPDASASAAPATPPAQIVPAPDPKATVAPATTTPVPATTPDASAAATTPPASAAPTAAPAAPSTDSKPAVPVQHMITTPKELEKELGTLTDEIPSIEFHFENTDLQNLVSQVAEIFQVTFLADEAITPLAAGSKTISGNKISFKTQKPLTRKDAWNLFVSFLDLSGLALVPQSDPAFFKITTIENAQRGPIRAFVGVNPKHLPDSDELIRFVYFIENNTVDAIKGVVDVLRSSTAPFQVLQDSKAFILIDKSYNIKALMQIVVELDKATLPQTLSVMKLKRADAKTVADLYASLSQSKDDQAITSRLFPARKQPTSLYFPENTRIIAEPRTNTLILLGTKDAITKIEDFITKHIDVDIEKPYSPLTVFPIRYADASTIADIMTQVTAFGKSNPNLLGAVRGEDKYLKNMTFTADKTTNSVVIGGEYDDYMKAIEIIQKLDEPQPQVAIEVLIVDVTVADNKQLGTALRSAVPGINGLVGNNVKFQTSGFNGAGIVDNSSGVGVDRLLGNLINLATGTSLGTTLITLGQDSFGVWGIFNALKTVTNAQVVANPFLTATNKTPAVVSVGTTRRVQTASVVGGGSSSGSPAFADDSANLEVDITPQINSDGMISLKLTVGFDQYLNPNPTDGTKTTRKIDTNAILADKEVLALGGLIQNHTAETVTKVPILGDIPILGWLFKNKQKTEDKDNLLILVSARIVKPDSELIKPFTQEKVNTYHKFIEDAEFPADRHDPVHKLFFAAGKTDTEVEMENFLFKRHGYSTAQSASKRKARTKRKKKSKYQQASIETNSSKKQVVL